ncbi:MAG: Flp pilus assembly protein CpaB [Polyangiaceae bacterium]
MYRRALFIALLCGIVSASLFALYLRRFEQEASGGERVRVLVALQTIERGKQVTDELLGVREVPRAYVEDRAIREADKNKILGLRSGGLVQTQQTLMWTDLAVASEEQRDLSALVLPGRRAVSTHFRSENTGAMIRPGDYVDVISVGASNGAGTEARTARVLLQRVLVLAVGDSMSAESSSENRSNGGRRDDLTLSVTLPEAQLLAVASERGVLSAALRSPIDNQTAGRVPDVSSTAPQDLALLDEPRRARANHPTELRSGSDFR